MPQQSGIQYGSGFRYGSAFALNANGRIAGNSATVPYTGIAFYGTKAWNLTIPPQRRIDHINADRVAAADFLPPVNAASGKIAVSADNQVIDAILMANKQRTFGEASMISDLTSNQGYEPLVGLMLYQQSLDFSSRLRGWRTFLIPRAKAITMPAGYADREVDGAYDVLMTPCATNIFGETLTSAVDGATDAQFQRLMSEGRPAIAAWVGDGATTIFTFPTTPVNMSPALTTNKIQVYVNGVLTSAGFTKTTLAVTFTVAPVTGTDIDIYWEY